MGSNNFSSTAAASVVTTAIVSFLCYAMPGIDTAEPGATSTSTASICSDLPLECCCSFEISYLLKYYLCSIGN